MVLQNGEPHKMRKNQTDLHKEDQPQNRLLVRYLIENEGKEKIDESYRSPAAKLKQPISGFERSLHNGKSNILSC